MQFVLGICVGHLSGQAGIAGPYSGENFMIGSIRLAAAPLAFTLLLAGQGIASAQMAPLVVLDYFYNLEAKKASAIPEHVSWCAANHSNYVAKWNNYKIPGKAERIACASPYYTPPWQVPYAKR